MHFMMFFTTQTHTHTQFSPLYRGVPWSDTSEIMLSFSRSVDELSVLWG